MASSSSSPCAACKFLRRKCTQECVFAPYFPPDHPRKFASVHKVFGASNVSKILSDLASHQREDAVISLYYEAEARIRDPVYGCSGVMSYLQKRHKQLLHDLQIARRELASYIGPEAMLPILQLQPYQPQNLSLQPQPQLQRQSSSSSSASMLTHQQQNMLYHQQQQQQQQICEAQQIAAFNAVARELHTEMFNNVLDAIPSGSVTVTGNNQLSTGGTSVTGMTPYLALVDGPSSNDMYQREEQLHYYHQLQKQQLEAQLHISKQPSQPLQLQSQETQSQTQLKSENEQCRTVIG